ncbi:ribonuclease P/MRP protein subunit POP5 [Harmonia axyridis]|uniref:ribonuclease P/MRP protein subunit POP5 n=1 Tax=Harmonia axyridis TaxID=115357 RepID=UPI001E278684|nr:ribonuclease P/MRP protein subunit POP5 [Harmonia axyridis]
MVRHKNRYFIIKIKATDVPKDAPLNLHPANLYGAITGAIQHLHGDFGVACSRSGFIVKYCNALTRIGIVRCRHGPHKLVGSAMNFVGNIGPYKAHIVTLYIGATLRHCFQFIKKYQEQKLEKYCANLKTEEEKAALKKMLLNMDSVESMQ